MVWYFSLKKKNLFFVVYVFGFLQIRILYISLVFQSSKAPPRTPDLNKILLNQPIRHFSLIIILFSLILEWTNTSCHPRVTTMSTNPNWGPGFCYLIWYLNLMIKWIIMELILDTINLIQIEFLMSLSLSCLDS